MVGKLRSAGSTCILDMRLFPVRYLFLKLNSRYGTVSYIFRWKIIGKITFYPFTVCYNSNLKIISDFGNYFLQKKTVIKKCMWKILNICYWFDTCTLKMDDYAILYVSFYEKKSPYFISNRRALKKMNNMQHLLQL